MSNLEQYNGLPENYFVIDSTTAPKKWPVDEVDCSIARAAAVLKLVVAALMGGNDRTESVILNDSLWSVQGDVAFVRELAQHHGAADISELARQIDSAINVVMISLDHGVATNHVLADTLLLIQSTLMVIKGMSDKLHHR